MSPIQIPKIRSGFTLVELLLVIALVALFSVAAISSLGSNEGVKTALDREKVLADIVGTKKESLLLGDPVGTLRFTKQSWGYEYIANSTTPYTLELLSTGTGSTVPAFQVVVKSSYDGVPFNVSNSNVNGATFNLYSEDTKSNIRSQILTWDGAQLASQFTLTGTTVLTDIMNFYFQNPANPKQASNKVTYTFFDVNNVNENIADDIVVVSLQAQDNSGIELTPSQCEVTFDGFGRATTSCDGAAVEKFTVMLDRLGSPSGGSTASSFTLPDDLQ